MFIHKLIIGLSFLYSFTPCFAFDREEDLFSFYHIQSHSLTHVLQDTNWLAEDAYLDSKPPLSTRDEVVSYYGNVAPTSLYKQGKVYFLPAAPVIYKYNPDFTFNYVETAYQLPITEKIKDFFGKSDIAKCFVVFQNLIQGDKQLLRLHGLVHGAQAGTVNANVSVAVEIIHHEEPIYFDKSAVFKTDSVHCHGGVASPNNFGLIGLKEDIYTDTPFWQSVAVYLPASKTATLIIVGNNKMDLLLTENASTPILATEFKNYFERLLKKRPL